MSTIPYFPLYAPDWIQDTAFMSVEAQGLFIQLLCYCWLHDGLPKDPRDLAKLTRLDVRTFKRIWKEINHKFIETSPELLANFYPEVSEKSPELLRNFSNTSLKLWNPRLLKERLKVIDLKQKKVKAGHLGGLARAKNLLKQKAKQKPSLSESESDKETKRGSEPVDNFDDEVKKQPEKKTRAKRSDSPLDFKKIEGLNLEAYQNWLDYRKKRSLAKYTTLGKAEALAELDFYEQMKCVQESIDSGYQGIWPKDWAAKLDRQNSQQGKNNNEYQPQEQRRPSPPAVAELKKQQAAAQRCEDLTRAQRETIAEKRALDDESAAVQRRETAKAHLGKLRSSEDGEATRLGVILKKAEQRLKE